MPRLTPILFIALLSTSLHAARPDHGKSWNLFRTRVQSLLKKKCGKCHAGKSRKAGLDLSTVKGIVAGSESGAVIEAGKPDESSLLEMIKSGEMPPKKEPQLTAAEIKLLQDWIALGGATSPQASEAKVSEDQIVPLLLLRCTACHGARRKEGNLDLRTRASILKGGKSGPAAVAGHPERSLLIQRIQKEEMPPRRLLVSVSVKTTQPHELKLLEQWIQQGLPKSTLGAVSGAGQVSQKDRQFWSFRSPRAVRPPPVDQRVDNPIDAFLLRKLKARGLGFSPAADPRTLIRRAYFDLTGLPPTPADIARFMKTPNPLAYQQLIERLLASPRYGERWGRHWLDVAGYADSEGAQNEDRIRKHMFRYRDYVIRSWNSDKSYDRFLHEQLAGDELADYRAAKTISNELYDNLVATGFLRTAPDRTFANITNFVPDRLEVVADEMQILGTAVLGLTIQCARCHSHKFDPIPQSDYYRLTAVFKGALDEHDWLKSQGPRTLNYVSSAERNEWQANENRISAEVKKIQTQIKKLKSAAEKKKLTKRIATLKAQRRPEPKIRALWSRGIPSPTYVLKRGNYLTPGRLVNPGVPTVLAKSVATYRVNKPWKGAEQTGRRLAFAKWLTQPTHPLTSRVMVNRIWKLHFGNGIVKTLSNFGKAGARPTHPELLDWLAVEFVRNQWSMKQIHRLIMTSQAYRQSSRVSPKSEQLDPDGTWLSRMPLKRMEAEVVRDSLLSVAGELNLQPFGPADGISERSDGLITSNRGPGGWRRSVFVLQRRTKIPTLLENFDLPQMSPNCIKRDESLVAPQALQLLNSKLVYQLSVSFADRVIREAGDDRDKQMTHVMQLALGRNPTRAERLAIGRTMEKITNGWLAEIRLGKKSGKREEQEKTAKKKALVNFCHAVMNSAAFIYID